MGQEEDAVHDLRSESVNKQAPAPIIQCRGLFIVADRLVLSLKYIV